MPTSSVYIGQGIITNSQQDRQQMAVSWYILSVKVAGGRGFEPLLAESESAVLPLDEPPITIFASVVLI
jgi:hypothetical protein